MSFRGFARLIAATVLLGATGVAASGGVAQAADAKGKPIDFTVRTDSSAITPLSQSLKWDAAKGHWGVTLDLRQTATRETNLNDIQAGALEGAWGAIADEAAQGAAAKIKALIEESNASSATASGAGRAKAVPRSKT